MITLFALFLAAVFALFNADTISGLLLSQQPATQPAVQTVPSALDPVRIETSNETEALLLELRSRQIDARAETVDWWLSAVAIALGFLTLIVVAAGFIGYQVFRSILEDARGYRDEAQKTLVEIREFRKGAEEVHDEINHLRQSAVDDPRDSTNAAEYDQNIEHAAKLDTVDSQPVNQDVAEAQRLQREGDVVGAIEKWQAIARHQEGTDQQLAARAWGAVGDLQAQATEYLLAISAYDEAVRLHPDAPQWRFSRGVAKTRQSLYQDAVEDFGEVIRLDPSIALAHYNLGVIRTRLGYHEDAIADLNASLRLNPDHARTYVFRGICRSNLGRDEDAISDYNTAIGMDPEYPLARYRRGISRSSLGRDEDAIEDFNAAISLNPNEPRMHYRLGLSLLLLGRDTEARESLEKALELANQDDYSDLIARIHRAMNLLDD